MSEFTCVCCGKKFPTLQMVADHERLMLLTEPQPTPSDGGEKTAAAFLTDAASLLTERGKTYDQEGGERSMGRCVTAFNAITGQGLSEAEGWLLLQILKDVRQWSKADFHADSAEDCISYAALKAESAARGGKERPNSPTVA